MSKRKLITTNEFPYHITARSNNKEFFDLPLEVVWKIILETAKLSEEKYEIEIFAFVLMSNHYHMIVMTPLSNIDKFMCYFQTQIAKKANSLAQRINHFFGGNYKWSIIDNQKYFLSALRYLFQNPVRAGICDRVEDYQFSTVRDFLKISQSKVQHSISRADYQIYDPFFTDKVMIKDWLNTILKDEENLAYKNGMKYSSFALKRNSKTGIKFEINDNLELLKKQK